MARILLPRNFTPRSYQEEAMRAFDLGCRRAAIVWHRRAGKDRTALAITSKELYQYPGVYWHLFPLLNQGRKILWDGRDREGKPFLDAFPPELIKRKLDQEMKIEFHNGSLWQIVGVDNVDSLVGANPRGIVFSEWSLIDPMTWKLLQPILLENGGWAMFIYTPRGKNHAHRTFLNAQKSPEWFCSLKTVRNTVRDAPGENGTPVISEADIDRIREEGEDGILVDEDTIQQEYYCSFTGSLQGAYYAEQMLKAENENRITRVPWDPRHGVHTAWDLGLSDATAVGCFQVIGREWRWIDYYENRKIGATRTSLKGYEAGMLGAIKWLKEKEYAYERHYGPHDIETGEISTGRSRKDFAKDHGIIFIAVPKHSPDDGIDAVRRQFSSFLFDEVKCEPLVSALRSYRKIWDPKKQEFQPKPYHDWASHAADMTRTGVAGWTPIIKAPRPTMAVGSDFNPLTYDDPRRRPIEAEFEFDPFTGLIRR